MIRLERLRTWFLIAVLTICGARPMVALPLQRTYTDIPINGKVAEILDRGTILFGTTGDYRPLSFCESDGTYWGFGIDVANENLLQMVNNVIREMKADGSLRKLHEKYGLVYAYE